MREGMPASVGSKTPWRRRGPEKSGEKYEKYSVLWLEAVGPIGASERGCADTRRALHVAQFEEWRSAEGTTRQRAPRLRCCTCRTPVSAGSNVRFMRLYAVAGPTLQL